MTVIAAGVFRRTAIERSDQRVSWERADQAFFASGACHILAWACRDVYPGQPVEIAVARHAGEWMPLHAYAVWEGWAFEQSGWNPEPEFIAVNADFEGRPLERLVITSGLAEFCEKYQHRMPHQYWADPVPRAREYVGRYLPPWEQAVSS
ncbi:hypothetical protein [Longispora albida]|uniref:hypothetical protein n=1 Tax=Longispora albida TaxID=203523 RepID=UPI00036BA47C|nr:hypothetical protein [Longispora albida]